MGGYFEGIFRWSLHIHRVDQSFIIFYYLWVAMLGRQDRRINRIKILILYVTRIVMCFYFLKRGGTDPSLFTNSSRNLLTVQILMYTSVRPFDRFWNNVVFFRTGREF